MIVEVGASGSVTLEDPENFTQFSVHSSSEALDASLRSCGAGYVVDKDAYINVDWVRSTGIERSAEPSWFEKLQGMLAFADTKGWLHDEGSSIQAHIEFV